nr:MAG TPA_asm: hypothetical protein [Bacteriophage sp.]
MKNNINFILKHPFYHKFYIYSFLSYKNIKI